MEPKYKHKKRYRRHKRIRAKISGTADRPRLCVFRSAKHIYCQLIDDERGQILAAASDLEIKKPRIIPPSREVQARQKKEKPSFAKAPEGKEEKKLTRKVALAFEVGKLIAQKALKKKIEKVVFDRGGYKYHGRVKALAEGAREGGLKF